MKLYTKKEILPILIILITAAIGVYFWPQLPSQVPSHWNVYGQIDSWVSKNFAVFFFPALILVLYLLLSFLPLMDPRKKNIEQFADVYFGLKVVFTLFMSGLYFLTLWAGLGHELNIGRWVIWGIAIMFLYFGWMMPKLKHNYTIGIRLPWTLHSETVWEKTHEFGGKLFIALAVLLAILGIWPGECAFWTLIGAIILMLAVLIWYSFREYRKINKS